MINRHILAATAAAGLLSFAAQSSMAVECVRGVYRAGCAGPNGAAVVKKPVPAAQPHVTCAAGVARAGCVGPNGAAVARRRY